MRFIFYELWENFLYRTGVNMINTLPLKIKMYLNDVQVPLLYSIKHNIGQYRKTKDTIPKNENMFIDTND